MSTYSSAFYNLYVTACSVHRRVNIVLQKSQLTYGVCTFEFILNSAHRNVKHSIMGNHAVSQSLSFRPQLVDNGILSISCHKRVLSTVTENHESFFFFFSVRLLSVLRGHWVFSSPPQRPMTSDFEGFSIPDFIHYIYFPILIIEKESVFPY